MGGRSSLLGALSIIERRWNSGNLPILVANTYGINFIKIGDIWTFHRGQGGLYFTTATLNLTLTFISELDLNIVLIYHCATKKVSIPSASKVRTRTDTHRQAETNRQTDRQTDTDTDRHRQTQKDTDRQTDRQTQTDTDRHTRDKNFTSPHTRAATTQLWRFHWYHHETLQYNLNHTKMKMLTLLLIRKFLPNSICCLFQSN